MVTCVVECLRALHFQEHNTRAQTYVSSLRHQRRFSIPLFTLCVHRPALPCCRARARRMLRRLGTCLPRSSSRSTPSSSSHLCARSTCDRHSRWVARCFGVCVGGGGRWHGPAGWCGCWYWCCVWLGMAYQGPCASGWCGLALLAVPLLQERLGLGACGCWLGAAARTTLRAAPTTTHVSVAAALCCPAVLLCLLCRWATTGPCPSPLTPTCA